MLVGLGGLALWVRQAERKSNADTPDEAIESMGSSASPTPVPKDHGTPPGNPAAQAKAAHLDKLFARDLSGASEAELEAAANGLIAEAGRLGISNSALSDYAGRNFQKIGALFAIMVCERTGPIGESDSREIVRAVAKTDLRQAAELSKHFGSGSEFAGVVTEILECISPTAPDTLEKLASLLAWYDDPVDRKEVASRLVTWILSRPDGIGEDRLVEICKHPEQYGDEPAEFARIALWAQQGKATTAAAIRLLDLDTGHIPPPFFGRVAGDLFDQEVPFDEVMAVMARADDQKAAANVALSAALGSAECLAKNLNQIAAYVGGSEDSAIGYRVAIDIFDHPTDVRHQLLASLPPAKRDEVLVTLAEIYNQRENAVNVREVISQITDPRTKAELQSKYEHDDKGE